MFAKRLFQKAKHRHDPQHGCMTLTDADLQVAVHYGIPYSASILAFDPIQRLLAIGTLDGRIKLIGGDNIEGLLISPKTLPYKSLQFVQNQGFLVSVSNENEIQVWDLQCRRLTDCMQWDSNITAFAVIQGTYLMYVGDENGLISVLKYNADESKLLRLPYQIPPDAGTEAAGISLPNHHTIVGILPQPAAGTRVLIAYEYGLLILWDVTENRVVGVRGHTVLQLKDEGLIDPLTGVGAENNENASEPGEGEREICSLCWASNNGSILAAGYINGDILLWNFAQTISTKEPSTGIPPNKVAKLQLASGNRRLPVIVLHWTANNQASNDRGGQLYVYGGDEIGSEEVLTVLSLDWSSGIETLRCISRVDLNLNGSFADMILIPNPGPTDKSSIATLFVLTNPGQLNVYDAASLSMVKSEENPSVESEKFPMVVPTIDPFITVTKFCSLAKDGDSMEALLEEAYAKKTGVTSALSAGSKWPLTGGVPSELYFSKSVGVERLYIAGYQDGSVRIWDATHPILTPVFVLEGKVSGYKLEGENAPVSSLGFCSRSMSLIVGYQSGLILAYKLHGITDKSTFHVVTETKHEIHNLHHVKGFHCSAAFLIQNSPIRTLQFAKSGDIFAVGFESGQVAMLCLSPPSIRSKPVGMSGSSSPVISLTMHVVQQSSLLTKSPEPSSVESSKDLSVPVVLTLTKDGHFSVLDSITGNMISLHPIHPKESTAISMYVIDGGNTFSEKDGQSYSLHVSNDKSSQSEPEESKNPNRSEFQEIDQPCTGHGSYACERFSDPLLLLCCEDALRLYSLKSAITGGDKVIRKVNLEKHCCWTTIFKKRDEETCGLILLYQTGVLEIRSLPELEVLAESSLMSILRWSFKTNMDRTMSSNCNGQISLVNGCEVAFISLLACGNDFRIPESLPSLHDKVVAAAADAAISLSLYQKNKQETTPGILGTFTKGLKGGKANTDFVVSDSKQLEEYFSGVPLSNPSTSSISKHEETDDLSIDDIEIDDAVPETSSLMHVNRISKGEGEEVERQKLFQGATIDVKPRVRTTQEILTQYRFAGDATAAAAHARDKLTQRQEKLERISRRTEELQSGAENFAEMANELVKTMEKKKWWKI